MSTFIRCLLKIQLGTKNIPFLPINGRSNVIGILLRTVADHKKSGNKPEFFYFFPEGWIKQEHQGTKT